MWEEVKGNVGSGVGKCWGEVWENIWGECEEYGEVCWGVGKGLEGVGESEGKCAGVWGEVWEMLGKVWESVLGCGERKGNEENSVREMGKVWQSVLGVGEE